jgi:prepilin-type N-terminal cleavage/methylation domain-containing protein
MHRRHQARPARRRRPAFTLFEIVIVVTIIVVLTAIAMPRTRHLLDQVAVHGAASDAMAMLDLARHTAMTRGERISVDIDSAPARLTMRAGADTIRKRNEQSAHGVHFAPSRSPVVYAQLGMGFGVSNLSLIVTRGAAAETVTVSRLGRVRR